MQRIFERKNEISDVLKWEVDPIYCRDYMEVDNEAGTEDKEFKVGECYQKSTGTKLTGSEAAVPAITTVTIAKSGDSTADATLIIGGVTFTAATTPSADDEYALDATAEQVAAIVAAKGLDGFNVVADGAKVIYTQSTAGTGTAPTASGTDSTITATPAETQAYKAAVDGNEEDIDFVVLENKVVYAGTKMTVLGLMRGPAIVDIKNVLCTDADAMKAQLATKSIITIAPSPMSVYQNT